MLFRSLPPQRHATRGCPSALQGAQLCSVAGEELPGQQGARLLAPILGLLPAAWAWRQPPCSGYEASPHHTHTHTHTRGNRRFWASRVTAQPKTTVWGLTPAMTERLIGLFCLSRCGLGLTPGEQLDWSRDERQCMLCQQYGDAAPNVSHDSLEDAHL